MNIYTLARNKYFDNNYSGLKFLTHILIASLLSGCGDSIEEFSSRELAGNSPPEVVAEMLENLRVLSTIENGTLSAYVFLDKGEPDEKTYEMSINYSKGTANYVITKLDLTIDYNVSIEFLYRSRYDPGIPLIIATTEQTAYKFAINKKLRFTPAQFDISQDYDNDTASNVSELIAGGNPFNPSPTFLNSSEVTVKEGTLLVQTIEALSPISGAMLDYQITNGADKDKFNISNSVLSFITEPKFDTTSDANNQYELEITASDGTFTSQQLITITVTDSFFFSLTAINGLKSMVFNWEVQRNAEYYKLLVSVDGIAPFSEVAGAVNIKRQWFNVDISSAPYALLQNHFKIQAYSANNILLKESADQSLGDSHSISDIYKMEPVNIRYWQKDSVNDQFGSSLVLATDALQQAIGAPFTDFGGDLNAGLVYVMRRYNTDDSWGVVLGSSNVQLIGLSEARAGYRYGTAISFNRDILAVGAPGADSGPGVSAGVPATTGAVYTYFVDSGLLWSAFVEKLFAIDGATGDNFGSSVAISGNGLILVAGAPNATATINNNHTSGTGAIYTFTRRPDTPAGWNRNPVNGSAANDSAYGDQFGSGIALSDDGTTLAVSSPRASLDVGGVIVKNAGAVYIYNSSFIGDSVWGNPIKLVSDEITESNAFGKNIFLTGDGLTLYVAEPSLAVSTDKTTVLGAGAIHIYHRQGNNWIRGQKLIDNNPTSQEQFGFEFSLSTDGSTIIVSAPYSDVKIDNTIIRRTGKALVFRRQKIGTDWNLIPALVLTARDPAEFDYFGYSVAISGDGRNISVGAPGAANIQPNIGPIQNIGVFYEF